MSFTNEYYTGIINYTTSNLVALLINRPELGLSNSPTLPQLEARLNLNMTTAVTWELNQATYSRAIVTNPIINLPTSNVLTAELTASVSFNGTIGPFTHIVFTRGANVAGANPANGNNRGSNQGTIVWIEAVLSAPLTVTAPATYTYTLTMPIQ
ncbi:MAG: hypothetical protein ACK518_02165 [bacterium]|jgi:hypothetical protein